jgi:hypothetical protein
MDVCIVDASKDSRARLQCLDSVSTCGLETNVMSWCSPKSVKIEEKSGRKLVSGDLLAPTSDEGLNASPGCMSGESVEISCGEGIMRVEMLAYTK